jgi:hypothetical protein
MKTPFDEVTLLASCQSAGLLAGAAIFVILFTVILTTLRRARIFPPGVNVSLPYARHSWQ